MENKFRLYFVVLILSITTLSLEVLQLRIFAYSLMGSIAHIVIGIALLGIGVGNVSVGIIPGVSRIKEEKLLSYLLLGFSLSVLITHIIFAHYYREINQDYDFPRLWFFSIIFSIPYVFFGATITFIFKKYVKETPKLYAINLVGSGLGCLLPLLALYPLGAEKLLILISLIVALCALFYISNTSRGMVVSAAGYVLFLLVGIHYADAMFNFKPKPHGALSRIADVTEVKKEFSKWDPLGRIEVYSYKDKYSYIFLPEPLAIKDMFQDGDAGSWLLNIGSNRYDYNNFFVGSIFTLVYQLRENPHTLIIGLGGAPDVLRALHFKSAHITGIEINKTTVNIVKETFRDFVGDPYGKDNVTVINMDGRYFVRTDNKKYDIIQLAGTDTDTTNLTSGALSVSENYLYTTEAFKDYFASLKPDGVLSIIRFGIREPMLILSTATTAMKEIGITQPYKNFVVVKQAICVNVLMKKKPFTPDEIKTIKGFVYGINRVAGNIVIPINNIVGWEALGKAEILSMPLQHPHVKSPFAEFMDSVISGKETEYISSFSQNILPLTDDRPFFFQYEKPENIFKHRNSVIYYLIKSAVQVLAFSILLIFLPVYILKKKKQSGTKYNFSYLVYFFSLGIGFMFVEIGLIQKSILFLGHPTYSFITVVLSLLLFSGLGSLVSGFLVRDNFKVIATAMSAIVVMILVYLFFMEDLYIKLLPPNTFYRMVVMGMLLSPLGFVMGIPFPKGIQLISARDINFVPVSFGINSVSSVLGALSFVPLAMVFGFSTLILIAAVIYGLGLISIIIGRRSFL